MLLQEDGGRIGGWGGWGEGEGRVGKVNRLPCLFQLLEVACVPWLVASPIYDASTGTSSSHFFFDLCVGATLSLTLIFPLPFRKNFCACVEPTQTALIRLVKFNK